MTGSFWIKAARDELSGPATTAGVIVMTTRRAAAGLENLVSSEFIKIAPSSSNFSAGYSGGRPRICFSRARRALSANLFSFAFLLGFVATRLFGTDTARKIMSCNLSAASIRFFSWLLERCALMVIMPLAEMRRSAIVRRRILTSSVSAADALMSNFN